MEHIILIKNLSEINKAAKEFVDYISDSDIQSNIFAFEAPMGAGKTTFIKAVCFVLGAGDVVNSPTFTIINEYRAAKGFPIFHFDFYRINKISEAYDIGIEEYFASEGLCLMEWPEKIREILPEETVYVKIIVNEDESRSVIIGELPQ
jgi:tRNA threonylcarbamoyladenosine biosynthesis protein TsaE